MENTETISLPQLLFLIALLVFVFEVGYLVGQTAMPLPPQSLNCVSSWSANVLTVICK